MSQLKTMTQKWFDEMEIFELETVVKECSTEAAEAVTDLRKEVRALLDELTKEREANQKMVEALDWYANPYNYSTEHLNKHGYILIDNDGGSQAREALGKSMQIIKQPVNVYGAAKYEAS